MRSNLLHLFFESLHSVIDRRATNCRSAAPMGPTSLGCGIRVAMHHQHILYRDAKLLRHDLGKCCFFSLTMWGRASIDHHSTALLNTYACAFIETNRYHSLGTNPADLNIGREANTHQLTIARGTPSGLFSTQTLVICQFKRLVQRRLIVAGIIDCPRSRFVGELVRLNEVDSSYFSGVLT